MKTLYIVRHAKSSWEYSGIKDIDRPLKKRGIKDAHLMSKFLFKKINRPDVFVSSSANRALHTSVIFCENFQYPLSNLKIKKQLYSFSDGYLVKTVNALDDSFNSAIIFSHDHGINTFVNKFGSKPISHVTTCGVIGIQFDEKHWKNIKKGKTFMVEFPKNHKQNSLLEIKKYGAIDIGSNAIRLLISNVIVSDEKEPKFKKSSLVRVPIRLGADAFTSGIISEQNVRRMIDAIEAFKLLMNVHGVKTYKACATSAMREAKNGSEIVEKIKVQTGVKIDIIGGKEEAAIISSTDLNQLIEGNHTYLYVDVGGGSTEITVFTRGKIITSKSFKIGTVRLLNNKKSTNKEIFSNVEKWIKKNTSDLKKVSLIGSGGNINKLFKMSGRTEGKPISYIYLNAQYQFLKQMSFDERVSELSLNPDRADVIIPATKIYLSAMKWSGARKIYVPKIGLSDGIIKSLFYNKF